MIRVYVRLPGDRIEDVERVTDPAEAEAFYLRLCLRRTDGPASAVIDATPRMPGVVEPAQYRLDAAWGAGLPREHVLERRRQVWAPAGEWTGPTPFQLRALPLATGLSASEIARRIGVTPRQWRRWASDPEAEQTRIPYSAWVAALRICGLLPDDEHVRIVWDAIPEDAGALGLRATARKLAIYAQRGRE